MNPRRFVPSMGDSQPYAGRVRLASGGPLRFIPPRRARREFTSLWRDLPRQKPSVVNATSFHRVDSPQMTTQPDYYLITFMTDERPYPWTWEIKRHSKPMGIRLLNGGYQSKASAVIAGRRALLEFLEELAKEEKRKR